MPHNQEGVCDVNMSSCHNSPHEVVDHCIVLVLSSAIVCMQVQICFPKTMDIKEVMQPADQRVGSLPYLTRLIREEVNLVRYGLTVYSKHRALSRGEKVDGAWLHWV